MTALRWAPDGQARGEIVLVHGIMALAETWWLVGPALAARGWSAVAVDLPGHGSMARLERPLDLDVLVDGVARQLPDRVDLLAGHSLGAVVALALVQRHPGAAGALVLEDPPAIGTVDPAALADAIEADVEAARRDRGALVRSGQEANPHWDPGDVECYVRGVEATDVVSVAAGLRGPLHWDLPALLAAAPVPVLVLAAPDGPGRFPADPGSAVRGTDRDVLRARLAADRFVVLDGGHCLHRDDPERWADAVTAFADAPTPRTA
jgi:pimeloyl-ACP methyl ester carboxylesterase